MKGKLPERPGITRNLGRIPSVIGKEFKKSLAGY